MKQASKKPKNISKVIVVCGPTATGKSDLSVELARRFNGEVISADSRQVYKGLDIGTGKITKREMKGVPHHLLDVADPKKQFSAEEFKKRAEKAVAEIIDRGKLPIICGGTGFYIQTLVDNISLPEVPPNPTLRAELEKKSAAALFTILKRLDPRRAKEIDAQNPRRLIRAIEIAKALGKVPRLKPQPKYEPLFIGIDLSDTELKGRIEKRLTKRLKQGMVQEAKRLKKSGLSWKRMNELGLEYRYLALLLQGKMTREEFIKKLSTEIWHYAKRQRTWFKKDERIKWFSPKNRSRIVSTLKTFLS